MATKPRLVALHALGDFNGVEIATDIFFTIISGSDTLRSTVFEDAARCGRRQIELLA